MSALKKTKAQCPQCGGQKNCSILGEKTRQWTQEDEDDVCWAESEYQLLECMGCDAIFTQIKSHNSEEYSHGIDTSGQDIINFHYSVITYPTQEEEEIRPHWLNDIRARDFQLYEIMNEMYSAYQSKSFILASIGLRTIFDRTTEVLSIHPGLPLNEKVDELRTAGFIGDTEREHLLIVTNAGNSAAHRAWSPNATEFRTLLDVIESFVLRTVVKGDNISHIAALLPKKTPRPKKPKK